MLSQIFIESLLNSFLKQLKRTLLYLSFVCLCIKVCVLHEFIWGIIVSCLSLSTAPNFIRETIQLLHTHTHNF